MVAMVAMALPRSRWRANTSGAEWPKRAIAGLEHGDGRRHGVQELEWATPASQASGSSTGLSPTPGAAIVEV
jgi:hypothetical protein